ncbi:MAG: hypothetical protein NT178_09630 [Proteobacteria bacterium]|nr:hypothetical protein [Pseudomonadota bacterium]
MTTHKSISCSSHGEREGKAPTALPVEGATQAPVNEEMPRSGAGKILHRMLREQYGKWSDHK